MNFDLEIISEEGDCSDPLFDSIMNAMSSMKEATADKIYQKIQREGETNYSKPQVDRALANALKYGIFEVKNNRYRMRDDILDDEDTVYWKLQRNREQTPFRIQDDINERQFGPKLDPERDNQRFRKMPEAEESECPQCGRTKRPSFDTRKSKTQKTGRNTGSPKRRKVGKKALRGGNTRTGSEEEYSKKTGKKRKNRSTSVSQERQTKVRRKAPKTRRVPSNTPIFLREDACKKNDGKNHEGGWADVKSDMTDSDLESVTSPSEDDISVSSRDEGDTMKFRRYKKPCLFSPEYDDADLSGSVAEKKKSSISMRSDSLSEKSDASSISGCGRSGSRFHETMPCSSSGASEEPKGRSEDKVCERGGTEESEGKSEWMGCSEKTQGAVIQSKNVLTIEPMDSLAFTSPGQASYIS